MKLQASRVESREALERRLQGLIEAALAVGQAQNLSALSDLIVRREFKFQIHA
jgi:hypothetical protein